MKHNKAGFAYIIAFAYAVAVVVAQAAIQAPPQLPEPEFADTGAMKRLGTGASSSEDVSDLSLTGASVADAGHASRLLSAALGRPVSGDELLSAAERATASR